MHNLPLWTWGGTYFGFREDDSLFTYKGVEAGQFHDEEIYGANGTYLGELKNGKLITRLSKKIKRKSWFIPRHLMRHVKFVNHIGSVMHVGYEDFPAPEIF